MAPGLSHPVCLLGPDHVLHIPSPLCVGSPWALYIQLETELFPRKKVSAAGGAALDTGCSPAQCPKTAVWPRCPGLGTPELAQDLMSWASQVIRMGSVTRYQLLISKEDPSLHLCFPMQSQNQELCPWLQGTSLVGDT